MDNDAHRDEETSTDRRDASSKPRDIDRSSSQHDELANRRQRGERSSGGLTQREREERWPIG